MELNSKKIYTILIVDGNDVKWLVESIYLAIENGKSGFERIYEWIQNKHFSVSGIGTNGYIVSLYPIRRY